MDEKERRKYIEEIFKHCKTDSILVITHAGELRRIYCPFIVVAVKDVPPIAEGDIVLVTAVGMSLELIDVYIIKRKAFYHYNFILYSSSG